MSLDYDFREVDTSDFDDDQYRILDILIWGTLALDLGEITEKNIKEWAFRMGFYDATLGGTSYYEKNVPIEGLKKCIGLKTNVFTTTRTKFIKKCVDRLKERCERAAEEWLKENAECPQLT